MGWPVVPTRRTVRRRSPHPSRIVRSRVARSVRPLPRSGPRIARPDPVRSPRLAGRGPGETTPARSSKRRPSTSARNRRRPAAPMPAGPSAGRTRQRMLREMLASDLPEPAVMALGSRVPRCSGESARSARSVAGANRSRVVHPATSGSALPRHGAVPHGLRYEWVRSPASRALAASGRTAASSAETSPGHRSPCPTPDQSRDRLLCIVLRSLRTPSLIVGTDAEAASRRGSTNSTVPSQAFRKMPRFT